MRTHIPRRSLLLCVAVNIGLVVLWGGLSVANGVGPSLVASGDGDWPIGSFLFTLLTAVVAVANLPTWIISLPIARTLGAGLSGEARLWLWVVVFILLLPVQWYMYFSVGRVIRRVFSGRAHG